LQRVRGVLEQAEAKNATKPTAVTLQGTMLLSEALAAVTEQTGNQIVDYRQRFGQQVTDVELELDLEAAPFWRALDAILDQADLTLYGYSGQQHTLAIVARDAEATPAGRRVAYADLFRIEATQVVAKRNLRAAGGDALVLTLEMTWEPRVLPIALQLPMDKLEVLDESGRPLSIAGREGNLEAPIQGTVGTVEVNVPLTLPPRSVESIGSFGGTLLARVPGRVESYTFDKLASAENVEQRRAGVTVVLQKVRRNREVYEVRVLVRFETAAGSLESHRGWVLENEAYLLDGAGERIDFATLEETRRTSNEAGLSYIFPLPEGLEGYRFIYKTPAAIVQLPVPFELKDIDLP